MHLLSCLTFGVALEEFDLNSLLLRKFYQLDAHKACAWLVKDCFTLSHLFVCVCVCVCVHPHLSRALRYVIPLLCHYSHERSGSCKKFAGSIGQGKSSRLVLCCLDGEGVVGNDDNHISY